MTTTLATPGAFRTRSIVRLLVVIMVVALSLPMLASSVTAVTQWEATDALATGRSDATATTLRDGRVLVAGGFNSGIGLASAELFDPTTRTWVAADSMTTPRGLHTATLLNDGTVLVAGGLGQTFQGTGAIISAEIFDPETGSWSSVADMTVPRLGHTATLLLDGRVLVAGGQLTTSLSFAEAAELYIPQQDRWTASAQPFKAVQHTASRLADGTVLVAGGLKTTNPDGSSTGDTFRYQPVQDTWVPVDSMVFARRDHTATVLQDGRVLVVGGILGPGDFRRSAEIFDPATDSWAPTGDLTFSRTGHSAELLADGSVLVAGGSAFGGLVGPAEILLLNTGTWLPTGELRQPRTAHVSVLLSDGSVLVAGGTGESSTLSEAELFPPNSPPVVGAAIQSLRLRTLRVDSIPVTVTWSALDPDGIARSGLRQVTNGSAPIAISVPPTNRSVTRFLVPGNRHRFDVRATDARGASSAFVIGQTRLLFVRQENSTDIAYSPTWINRTVATFFGGRSRSADAAGETATFTFTGSSVAWVSSYAPDRGLAEVILDGRSVGIFDLCAATVRARQVVVSFNGLANTSHTLVVRVVGSSSAGCTSTRVDVDAFVVLR